MGNALIFGNNKYMPIKNSFKKNILGKDRLALVHKSSLPGKISCLAQTSPKPAILFLTWALWQGNTALRPQK